MAEKLTPMMRQYRRIRSELPSGVILFFRLGDFFEMFFEDAKEAAPILDIALTKRNGVPMCGVPAHSVDGYLAKLIRAGRKVAIGDQVEDAAEAKGIVRREVTRIITSGTVLEEGILESNRNNYLAGVCRVGTGFGLAMLDLSTGGFWGEEVPTAELLEDALRRFGPMECVVPADQVDDQGFVRLSAAMASGQLSPCDEWMFDVGAARDTLTRHFAVRSLEGFGCEDRNAVVAAAGGVLCYVKDTLHRQVEHVRTFRVREASEFCVLDEATCSNLDLVELRRGSGQGETVSLLGVLDVTRTAMGGRLLRDWILHPLANVNAICARHDAVEAFYGDRGLLRDVRDALGGVRDLERLAARISSGGGNARDLVAVSQSLQAVPALKELTGSTGCGLLGGLADQMVCLPGVVTLMGDALVDEPPVTIREGGMVKPGFRPALDELRAIGSEGKEWLARYQATEQARTGIKNLKVRHNKVFGYYIEVSKGQLENVPAEYVRKQTLVNAERFITPELKDYEGKVLGAHERTVAMEYEVFCEVRDAVVAEMVGLQATAEAVACLDVLTALADRALALRYVRPVMQDGDVLNVKGGRHPIVEQMRDAERFVPNDTLLDCTENQLIIITGPNMAGKSTYIRQVAVISVMAQMGSFVPADAAEMGVVDRVFTRVGASDDLARGRSTFMVEMQETANILNNATPRSLIVLDEIGRGTSTFDGISIAWAVAEYLHNTADTKAKTLFATHYHELTDLALTMDGVKNYNVLVREQNDQVVFLRRIVEGASDQSYGIQVGRLAGLPDSVVARAKEVLANLEDGELGETGQPKIARRRGSRGADDGSQLDLFSSMTSPDG